MLGSISPEAVPDKAQLKVVHATIKKVGEDIEALSFNTAIAQMMIYVNAFTGVTPRPVSAVRTLLQLLNPFAPHLTSELWEILNRNFPGPAGALEDQSWPEYDPALLIEDEIEMVIQVNGKNRDRMVVGKEASKAQIEAAARANARVQEFAAGKEIKKIIVVPGKLVNVVVA